MTTTTYPNLQGAHLTGFLLALAKRPAYLPYEERIGLLNVLLQAHEQFPSLNSADVLAEVRALRHQLQDELDALWYEAAQEKRRDELERFRDLDGDHHEESAERLPEHDYPR